MHFVATVGEGEEGKGIVGRQAEGSELAATSRAGPHLRLCSSILPPCLPTHPLNYYIKYTVGIASFNAFLLYIIYTII